MIVQVLVEAGPRNWGASAAEGIGGVVLATGATRDEVIRQFKEALSSHLECLKELGEEVPLIEGYEIRELIPA